jgi:DinB superfamily
LERYGSRRPSDSWKETDWIPRARVILEHGEGKTFEPFDRFARKERSVDWSLEKLLDLFAELRATTLETLRQWSLTDTHVTKRGLHPELGPVTLQKLLTTWGVHDLSHIAQVARVMDKRYSGEVVAWRAYLSTLSR